MLDQLENAPIGLHGNRPISICAALAFLGCVAREVVDAVIWSAPTRTEDASVCMHGLEGGTRPKRTGGMVVP